MNCSTCGGMMRYVNGMYICENCGNKHTIPDFFESTEVFICYIENDEQGRRTRDSVIAQDLYNKLEQCKIKTFYQRVSAADLVSENFAIAYNVAIDKAKILLVLGTTIDHFQQLLERYQNYFSDKKIIPIYSYMNVYNIPKELGSLQAINYDNIGAVSDLTKNILYILGRENEVDIIKNTYTRTRRSKRIAIVSICAVLVAALAVGSYVVFGTPYVLKSKKYLYVQELLDNGSYASAIELLFELEDYENSKTMLNDLYNKYDGYYNNDDNTLGLHLDIDNSFVANIEVRRIINGNMISMNASAQANGTHIVFEFKDNQGNQGNGSIELHDSAIDLVINTQSDNISMGNIDVSFGLKNKSEAPVSVEITKSDLIDWLTSKITESELKKKGIELEFDSQITRGDDQVLYTIKNTDIKLVMHKINAQYEYYFDKSFIPSNTEYSDDRFLIQVLAPAQLIIPDKLSSSIVLPYIEKNIAYIPAATPNYVYCFDNAYPVVQLDANTPVMVALKNLNPYIQNYIDQINTPEGTAEYLLKAQLHKEHGESFIKTEIISEDDTYYILKGAYEISNNNMKRGIYKFNKATKEIVYIGDDE